MTTIYRIETFDGYGPYRLGKIINTSPTFNRPMPFDDGIPIKATPSVNPTFFCGFDSLDKLLQWFDSLNDLITLKQKEYFVAIYECPEEMVHRGQRQLVFVKNKATFKDLIPL